MLCFLFTFQSLTFIPLSFPSSFLFPFCSFSRSHSLHEHEHEHDQQSTSAPSEGCFCTKGSDDGKGSAKIDEDEGEESYGGHVRMKQGRIDEWMGGLRDGWMD
jgi:hypothetical protein